MESALPLRKAAARYGSTHRFPVTAGANRDARKSFPLSQRLFRPGILHLRTEKHHEIISLGSGGNGIALCWGTDDRIPALRAELRTHFDDFAFAACAPFRRDWVRNLRS
jgi:hypothetical protein